MLERGIFERTDGFGFGVVGRTSALKEFPGVGVRARQSGMRWRAALSQRLPMREKQ
jgi:hypothetical protein